jgi:hypothetical protein
VDRKEPLSAEFLMSDFVNWCARMGVQRRTRTRQPRKVESDSAYAPTPTEFDADAVAAGLRVGRVTAYKLLEGGVITPSVGLKTDGSGC